MTNKKSDGKNADVLIVGAGASGGVAALELIRRGFTVVCLEQGDWARNDDFTGDKPQWELARLKQWNAAPNTRAAACIPYRSDRRLFQSGSSCLP